MAPRKRNGPTPQRQFDPVYYSVCYADVLSSGTSPLSHYKNFGWKAGLNPNAFFSTRHYLTANPDVLKARIDPFEHFIASADDTRPYASPVFDPKFYLISNSDVDSLSSGVEHHWREGRKQGRPASVLFDVPYYKSQLRDIDHGIDCLEHYLSVGWKKGLSPHPLFDSQYYQDQLTGPERLIAPLAHYIEKGSKEGVSPHPLFDPAYYLLNLAGPIDDVPLAHYLMKEKWDSAPHYLFSDSYYVNAVEKSALKGTPEEYRSGPPLIHYCETGAKRAIPPHPLFDVPYYKGQAERLIRESGQPTSAIAPLERNPLKHYCQIGAELGVSPTPLFDRDFYSAQFSKPLSVDPLRHYLFEGFGFASPHPAIDLGYYVRCQRDFLPHELPVILDLLMRPQEERFSTHPAFDLEYYLERNPDIRKSGRCPILHFIEHGLKEGRQPNPLFTYPYAHRLCDPSAPGFWNPVDGYFRASGNKRPRILFLSHDASQSGAPLVLLGLIAQASAANSIECVTVLGAGGPLIEDFVHQSLTYVVKNKDRTFLEWNRHSPEFKDEMAPIVRMLEDNPPALIVCNSLESRHLANLFVSSGFGPMIALVHEVADPYDAAHVSPLLAASDLSIFVSEYQLGRMRNKIAFDEGKSVVTQFGALDQWFGSGDLQAARREVLTELGLAEGARIVLACGTMNFRKGIDLFAEVACTVLDRMDESEDVHFVWVGGGETHYDSAYYWADKLVRDRGFDANVHFVGEKFQTEKYFLAADLFVLTSRADPFPCVVQEAMACSLPIVAFAGTSGAAEAVGDSGIIVPFGAGAMAEAVRDLLANEFQRLKRAKRAKEILQTKNTPSSYAREIFEHMHKSAPAISHRVLAQIDSKVGAAAEDRPTIFLAVSSWDCGEASLYVQHVANQMIESGLDAKLLFTHGPSVLKRSDKKSPLPEAPFSFLHPKSQSPEHVREAIVRHLTTTRRPCVFVPYSDDTSFEVIPALPSHVATMALIHGDNRLLADRVYSLSRQFDRIVCTSADARQELVEANPLLESAISLIPVRITSESVEHETAARLRRFPTDEIRVVCAGFDNEELSKAVSCVKLAKLLREEGVTFKLTVLVDAAEGIAIRAVAPDLVNSGILSLVKFPSLTEIRMALASSDLLFFGSAGGSTALLVREAMAVGCVPIFRLSQQSNAGALQDGINSHILESGNLREVAQIIRDQQRAPERLAKMSRAAKKVFRPGMDDGKLRGEEYADACRDALATRALKRKEPRPHQQGMVGFLRTA